MLNKESKHLARQMMKFVYLFSKSNLSVLNMSYKYDAATQGNRVYSFDLHTILLNIDPKHDSLQVHWHPSCKEIVSKYDVLQVMFVYMI